MKGASSGNCQAFVCSVDEMGVRMEMRLWQWLRAGISLRNIIARTGK